MLKDHVEDKRSSHVEPYYLDTDFKDYSLVLIFGKTNVIRGTSQKFH